jgi:hypothetical protein
MNKVPHAGDILEFRTYHDQPISLCAPFRGTFLVTFDFFEFCYFYTHVVLKLPEHSRFVAELEKDF